jgi:hypothetical protein
LESKKGEVERNLINLDKAAELYGKSVDTYNELLAEIAQL